MDSSEEYTHRAEFGIKELNHLIVFDEGYYVILDATTEDVNKLLNTHSTTTKVANKCNKA